MARTSRYEDVKVDVLTKLHMVEQRHGQPPSVRDLATSFGVSVSTMHSYLKRLAEEGLVQWTRGRHRSLRLTLLGIQQSSQPVP